MEQDLGPASTLPSAREVGLRGLFRARVVGLGLIGRSRPSLILSVGSRWRYGIQAVILGPDRWPVFGIGGNDQQRQTWAFVPRR